MNILLDIPMFNNSIIPHILECQFFITYTLYHYDISKNRLNKKYPFKAYLTTSLAICHSIID